MPEENGKVLQSFGLTKVSHHVGEMQKETNLKEEPESHPPKGKWSCIYILRSKEERLFFWRENVR